LHQSFDETFEEFFFQIEIGMNEKLEICSERISVVDQKQLALSLSPKIGRAHV